jgi:hypothetical protein
MPKKININSRLDKLEKTKPENEFPEIRVYWGNPNEPKPEPGEILIEWGAGDTITRRKIPGGESVNKNTN